MSKTDETERDWSNYWSGRTGRASGEALAGAVGVETDPEIAQFWEAVLSDSPKQTRFLDMACGAGSVVRRAVALGLTDVSGADISPQAIETMRAEFPAVKGVVTSAAKTDFADHSFDLVASQFGFEYAGASDAAKEMARLIAPGGRFIALSHMTGSAIEREVAGKKAEADALLASGFIPASRDMFYAAFGTEKAVFGAATKAFKGPQAIVLDMARRHGGFAAHLYGGVQKLYEGIEKYAPQDIHGWLNGMEGEISAFSGRMGSMIDAALTRDEAENVMAVLQEAGMATKPLETLKVRKARDEIAWIIQAVRPKR